MQTRKFSLQNFKGGRPLSREEMKNVLGGVAASPAGGSTSGGGDTTCSWTWAAGYSGSSKTTSCTGGATWCQQQADSFCSSSDACVDVDCESN